jgi:hypothetical protein
VEVKEPGKSRAGVRGIEDKNFHPEVPGVAEVSPDLPVFDEAATTTLQELSFLQRTTIPRSRLGLSSTKERTMALEDKKPAPGLEADERVAAAIGERLEDGLLSCSAALAVAEELGCSAMVVGQTADVLGTRLTRCQLGLFGYPGHSKGWVEAGVAELPVPAGLERAIGEGRDEQGDIGCRELWHLAESFGVSRIDVGYLADRLGIRIRHCKLGAF